MSRISYLFDFTIAPNFFRFINKKFDVAKMNGANNFEYVLASYSPDNIRQCIDANNLLNNKVTVYSTVVSGLNFVEDEEGTVFCRVAKNTTFNLGDDIVPLKAIFIRDKTTKSVLAYCINITPFEATNSFVFDKDTIIFTIRDGDVNG